MLEIGYKASAEQFDATELLGYARLAEEVGFDSIAVSDHFQPFRHTGGHAPAALPWLGALTVLAFLAFLALYLPVLSYTGTDAQRPALSLVVTFEWAVLIGIIAWTFAASFSWWRNNIGARA